jgi:hypothetical protein
MSNTANRRAQQHLARAGRVLTAMEEGAVLHLHYVGPPSLHAGPRWALSDGTRVTDDVARLVIGSGSVTSVGDGLLANGPPQTWKWWRP